MKRTPLDLAAVATAAVPGLEAVQVGRLPDDAQDFDAALVVDAKGGRWRVRSPKHPEASLRLETELRALGGLSPAVRATLPFSVPTVAGTVKRGELKTFIYHHLTGHVLTLDELLASEQLQRLAGETIAAIHEIDRATVTRAGLAAYTAEEFRLARLAELDQVAASGKVPSSLLRRWENAFEDVSLWRFNPAAVHGDLHEEQLFVDEGRIVAVTGWSDLHVGDPAEDLAWLLALGEPRIIDAVVGAYSARRGEKADPHLMARATLAAEFALARWLARGITRGDAEVTAQAQEMLDELAANLAELGDRPIGIVEAEPEKPSAQPGAGPAQERVPAVTELPPLPDAAGSAPEASSASGAAKEGDEAAKAPSDKLPAADSKDSTSDVDASVDDDADAVITDAEAAEPETDALPVLPSPEAGKKPVEQEPAKDASVTSEDARDEAADADPKDSKDSASDA